MTADASATTTVDQLRPWSKGVNVVVKVVDAKASDRAKGPRGATGKSVECVVGDSTAAILFVARGDENVDVLQQGAYVAVHNAKVEVVRGSMRLVLDKGGKVETAEGQSFRPAVGNNLSLIEFEMVTVPVA